MDREATRLFRRLSRLSWSAALICLGSVANGETLSRERSASESQTGTQSGSQPCSIDPASAFQKGQFALQSNNLDEAERAFRAVIACDPKSAGAHVNLGVVEMRRKRWQQALAELRKAQTLAPKMHGIELNLGLVYFNQGDYRSAIPVLRSIVASDPTVQARYLLGLSYFFTGKYSAAVNDLYQNWAEQDRDLMYLYVLGISAQESGNRELADRSFQRLLEVGSGSPELHLLRGKAFLNRAQPDEAIPELERAAAANPKLPFVHFNLGWAYARKRDYDRARSEFLQDVAIEPDVPYNYEQLGEMAQALGNDSAAERYYNQALALDARLPTSLYGLGKVYERRDRPAEALTYWKKAVEFAPYSIALHSALARLLQRLGKRTEAAREAAVVNELERKQHVDELANPRLPTPELHAQH